MESSSQSTPTSSHFSIQSILSSHEHSSAQGHRASPPAFVSPPTLAPSPAGHSPSASRHLFRNHSPYHQKEVSHRIATIPLYLHSNISDGCNISITTGMNRISSSSRIIPIITNLNSDKDNGNKDSINTSCLHLPHYLPFIQHPRYLLYPRYSHYHRCHYHTSYLSRTSKITDTIISSNFITPTAKTSPPNKLAGSSTTFLWLNIQIRAEVEWERLESTNPL
ncbi:uncharacterized protein SPSK_00590 [Sporothrix schenckii 1099-18]|uniref:Uncharacterized protein n=1 Tax=Sporothrix schenckii 1099-18 TaxID=1397361 RepID=A0A0F2LUC6_SPOSC|nr:uncharacterized protein SPSK_00590 [Sporothrix schenckii 1099-18]KJR80120.1 hypothetical protein SPSK_00590 [Sporothrix schenckii 1099-18]